MSDSTKKEESASGLARQTIFAASLVPALAGLVASAALVVDYVRPMPVFCDDAGSGCGAVKRTVFAQILGVPTPVIGVAAFLVMASLLLQRGPRVRAVLVGVASAAAAFALLLLGVQATIGRWCPFCVTTDVSTLLLAGFAMWRFKAEWDPPATALPRAVGGALVAAALAAPLYVGFTRKIPVPDAIAAELARGDARVTIVDFVDFECPFCRMTHAELQPIVSANAARVHMVRKQVPLTRIHPHAMDAARAACCGEALGKGDAMADALFNAPVDDLTREGCEKIAQSLGIDADAYRKCIVDPKTDARIQSDAAEFKAAQGRGLPTLWIDDAKLEGAQSGEELERVLQAAIARKS